MCTQRGPEFGLAAQEEVLALPVLAATKDKTLTASGLDLLPVPMRLLRMVLGGLRWPWALDGSDVAIRCKVSGTLP